MSNPFQDQLLKAGLVTKQQVRTAKSEKTKHNKQHRAPKGASTLNETALKAQVIAGEQADQARELNRIKQEQARQKAIVAEIGQLINSHKIKRDESCDIAYNFEHDKKVKSIYINKEMKQQIVAGKVGIACMDGNSELVLKSIAEKILQRDAQYIVLFSNDQQTNDANDPYAKFQVPDDLMW